MSLPASDVYLAATARLGVAPAVGCSVVHSGAGPPTPPFPGAVGTVSDQRDLLLRLGLQPPAHDDGKGRA